MEPHHWGAGLAKLWRSSKRKEPEPVNHPVKPTETQASRGSKYYLIFQASPPFSCVLPQEEVIKLVEHGQCVYCKHSPLKVQVSHWRGHGCTPSFTVQCSSCKKSYKHHTSALWEKPLAQKSELERSESHQTPNTLRVVPVLFLVGILLSGLTYHQVSSSSSVSDYRLLNCCIMWT